MFGDQFGLFVYLFQLKLFCPGDEVLEPLWGPQELFSQLLGNVNPASHLVSSCLWLIRD